jgi:hypothetical protein
VINRERWEKEIEERLDPEWRKPINLPNAISVGEGWKTIVCDLIDRLDQIGVPYKILQVKEKFGTLRFYVDKEGEAGGFSEAIEKAMKASAITCEDCGARGKLRGDAWVRTLCVPCNKKFLKARAERWPAKK